MIAAISARTKRIAALVLILFFAAPLGAGAECAWVLWAQPKVAKRGSVLEGTDNVIARVQMEQWQPHAAYSTKAECERAIDAKTREIAKIITEGTQERLEHIQVRCLPDTVDPRGPKGK